MQRIIIVYDSINGSTRTAAEIIAQELRREFNVEFHSVEQAPAPNNFDTVIIGSYVRYGKISGPLRRYLKKYSAGLSGKLILHYFSCMHLAKDSSPHKIPIYYDPAFNQEPQALGRMSFADRQHASSLYMEKLLKVSPETSGVAFMKGRMRYALLPPADRISMRCLGLFMKAAREGDSFRPEQAKAFAIKISELIGENS